ncbi:hypothetical protein DFR52_101727 [Hoeflea marina]|uniref:Uncharacterized protein n=1 Tax=Hoeflea marina TaxID=274592 RepID=A0A317PSZ2_9HYPH|nr:hypothetical protein [Hoeflea marina]PWW04037.1 hypothetical protein DFR52_101727 [Hoeflea marina]
MSDSSAPYILSLLVAGLGWLINSSVAEFKALNLIEYELTRVEADYKGSRQAYVNIDISNRSYSKALLSGAFTFICVEADRDSCFGHSGGSADKPLDTDLITFQPLEGVGMKSRTRVDGGVSQLSGDARIMPQSAVRYRVMVTRPDQEFLVLLDYPATAVDASALQFREGSSLEGWVVRNYLTILLTGFIIVSVILALWFATAFLAAVGARLRPSPPPAKQAEKHDVHISFT